MPHHNVPIIGSWYESKQAPDNFVVLDDDDEYVEVQYKDGQLDKIDIEAWDAMHPQEIPEPEDATAPYGIDHEEDIVKLLNEIEEQQDLNEHLRFIDSDEEKWD